MPLRFLGAALMFAVAAGCWAGGDGPSPLAGPVATSSREGPTEAELEAEFQRSRRALRESSEFKGTDAGTRLRLGAALHHRGDLTGAADEYRAVIELEPSSVEAYRGLGVVLLDRHDWAGAAEALRAALRLRPDDPELLYWLGRSLMAQRDYSGAAAALRRTTQLKPDDAEAFADLGLVRMVQGDPGGAADALEHAVRLNPDNADAHQRLETVMTFRHDPAQVVRAARRILDTMFARE